MFALIVDLDLFEKIINDKSEAKSIDMISDNDTSAQDIDIYVASISHEGKCGPYYKIPGPCAHTRL